MARFVTVIELMPVAIVTVPSPETSIDGSGATSATAICSPTGNEPAITHCVDVDVRDHRDALGRAGDVRVGVSGHVELERLPAEHVAAGRERLADLQLPEDGRVDEVHLRLGRDVADRHLDGRLRLIRFAEKRRSAGSVDTEVIWMPCRAASVIVTLPPGTWIGPVHWPA